MDKEKIKKEVEQIIEDSGQEFDDYFSNDFFMSVILSDNPLLTFLENIEEINEQAITYFDERGDYEEKKYYEKIDVRIKTLIKEVRECQN